MEKGGQEGGGETQEEREKEVRIGGEDGEENTQQEYSKHSSQVRDVVLICNKVLALVLQPPFVY